MDGQAQGQPAERDKPSLTTGLRSINVDGASEPARSDDVPEVVINNSRPSHVSRLLRKYSIQSLSILFVSVIVLIAVFVFLIFLWFSNHSNHVWMRIILNNWATRSASLSALFIRWVVSAQVVICTSMLAALVLQEGVALKQAAAVSSARYSNSGPWDLFWRMSGGWKWNILTTGLLMALILTTLASQFTSTILLSDILLDTVRGFPTQHNTSTRFVTWERWNSIPVYDDQFVATTPSYPIFAEWSAPPNTAIPEIDDTGPMLRALLPIGSTDVRGSLQSFQGPATVIDSRVVCTQPDFSNLTFVGSAFKNTLVLRGIVKPKYSIPELIYNGSGIAFSCAAPYFDMAPYGNSGWSTTACVLDPSAGGLLSSLNLAFNTSLDYYYGGAPNTYPNYWTAHEFDFNATNQIPAPVGSAYMLLNFTGTSVRALALDGGGSEVDFSLTFNAVSDLTVTSRGSWVFVTSQDANATHADYLSGAYPWNVGASICYDSMYVVKNLQINASRIVNHTEPSLPRDGQYQIGATLPRRAPAERGIMDLDFAGIKRQLETERDEIYQSGNYGDYDALRSVYHTLNELTWFMPWGSVHTSSGEGTTLDMQISQFDASPSRVMTPYITAVEPGYRSVNYARAMLFQLTIKGTFSGTLALQGQLHTMLTTAYYTYHSYFEDSLPHLRTVFSEALAPVRHRGLYAVIGIVSAHLLLVAAVIVLFARNSDHTFLGSAWQEHAQVFAPETTPILRVATCATDKDVGSFLTQTGKLKQRVVLGSLGDEGRIALQTVGGQTPTTDVLSESVEDQSVESQSTEHQAVEGQPADDQSMEEQPVEDDCVRDQSTETQSVPNQP